MVAEALGQELEVANQLGREGLKTSSVVDPRPVLDQEVVILIIMTLATAVEVEVVTREGGVLVCASVCRPTVKPVCLIGL